MRAFASRSLLLAGLLVMVATGANAQVNPLWDHYKVYETAPFPVPPLGLPVLLTDQFGPYNHQVLQLQKFMNPVQKQVATPGGGTYPINDPITHYSWWTISPQPFSALVAATNQFGDQSLNVHDAVYLLAPALKNQHGSPPQKNHYKCYLCDGQPVNVPVLMTDQFGQWGATVTFPRYFCNPVQKQVAPPGGPTYPILDPNQHYVCYEFQPQDPNVYTAVMTDQFTTDHQMDLNQSRYICVPTYKQGFTATTKPTWGRMKMLYR